MKMVTYFNRKDIVSFGNYLLSQTRDEMTSEFNKKNVTHADVENWKDGLKRKKEEDG